MNRHGTPQNLKVLSSNEARLNGKKGGIKSAKAQKEKKLIKNFLNCLLDMGVSESNKQALREQFPDLAEDELCNQAMMAATLISDYFGTDGRSPTINERVRLFRTICDYSGNQPVIETVQTDATGSDLSRMEAKLEALSDEELDAIINAAKKPDLSKCSREELLEALEKLESGATTV